jgi:hypothetical protein
VWVLWRISTVWGCGRAFLTLPFGTPFYLWTETSKWIVMITIIIALIWEFSCCAHLLPFVSKIIRNRPTTRYASVRRSSTLTGKTIARKLMDTTFKETVRGTQHKMVLAQKSIKIFVSCHIRHENEAKWLDIVGIVVLAMESGMCLLFCLNNKNITVLESKFITRFMARNVDTKSKSFSWLATYWLV